jgi:Flp pilus assembly protein TadB
MVGGPSADGHLVSGTVLGALAAGLVVALALVVRAAGAAARVSLVATRLQGRPPGRAWAGLALSALPAPPDRLVRALAAAGLAVDARMIWGAWLSTAALALLGALVAAGPGLALVAVLVTVVGPAVALRAASGRAERQLEDDLPEALEAMARALRSGASLRQAVGEASATIPGTLGADLGRVAGEVAQGGVLTEALDRWAERRALPGVRLATSALGLGAETGGAQARALDGVAATLRSRLGVGREVRALSSQARLSGVVITLAPLGFSALAAATDDRTAAFLLGTPLGLICLTTGLALDGLAALWMQRLSRVEA